MQIQFAAAWGDQAITCEGAETALTDLRFFISNLMLVDAMGAEHPVSLIPDGRWQRQDIVLVDMEDGSEACDNGTPDTNSMIRGTAGDSDFVGLKFTIGVPFDMNHANPLLALPPLDQAAMHWHWRSGYKFLRAGVATPTDGFWMHLGSTGCEGTIPNITECSFPNRVRVELTDFSPGDDQITIDLGELFRGIELRDGVRSDCSSSPAEASCARPFGALGLGFNNSSNQQLQRVFQVRH